MGKGVDKCKKVWKEAKASKSINQILLEELIISHFLLRNWCMDTLVRLCNLWTYYVFKISVAKSIFTSCWTCDNLFVLIIETIGQSVAANLTSGFDTNCQWWETRFMGIVFVCCINLFGDNIACNCFTSHRFCPFSYWNAVPRGNVSTNLQKSTDTCNYLTKYTDTNKTIMIYTEPSP